MTFILMKKLLRDVKTHKGQYIACVFIIALGLLLFSGMRSVVEALENSTNAFYEKYRMADAWASVQSFPAGEVERLSSVPGVLGASGRIVKSSRVIGLSEEKNIFLRLISAADSPGESLNGYRVLLGREPQNNEILVGEGFFNAWDLKLYDTITLLINGRETEFIISGVAQGPEYVYVMPENGALFPDYATFDICYASYEAMDALYAMGGLVNDLSFSLSSEYSDAKPLLLDELSPYGLLSLYPREDQLSAAMLSEEISGVKMMSTSLPLMFLAIAAIITYLMVGRIVDRQRAQVGTMKAFGYSGRDVRLHYALYGALIGFFGGLIGGLSGVALSGSLIETYKMYFNIPGFTGTGSPLYIPISILLSLPFCTAAAFMAARKGAKLRPVEALSPDVPPPGKRTLFERIGFIWNAFTTTGQMALRNMARAKVRLAFTGMGVMFAFSMCAVLFTYNGMMEDMLTAQIIQVQRFDLRVNISGYRRTGQLESGFSGEDGVFLAEGLLSVPVRIFKGARSSDTIALGLTPESALYRLQTEEREPVVLPESGLVLTRAVAKKLDAHPGDRISVYSPVLDTGREIRRETFVANVIEQSLGGNAYAERSYLAELFELPDVSNAVLLKLDDPAVGPALSEKYLKMPGVLSIEDVEAVRTQYEERLAPYGVIILAMVLVGIFTGFAIVYNTTIITLSERARELASMRVLGFTVGETTEVLTIEQTAAAILGSALGIPLSNLMMSSMSKSYENQFFSMPGEVPAYCLALSGICAAVMVVLATFAVLRKVRALDMVEVLKAGE